MERAFKEAMVDDFDHLLAVCDAAPDAKDRHVLAAAIKTRADVIVTDNLKHFPDRMLATFGIEARSADDFIADTAMLDIGRAMTAFRQMRSDYVNPAMSVEDLFIKMDDQGLTETVDVLRHYAELL